MKTRLPFVFLFAIGIMLAGLPPGNEAARLWPYKKGNLDYRQSFE